eukprot:2198831-Amphidinium_carterae.1
MESQTRCLAWTTTISLISWEYETLLLTTRIEAVKLQHPEWQKTTMTNKERTSALAAGADNRQETEQERKERYAKMVCKFFASDDGCKKGKSCEAKRVPKDLRPTLRSVNIGACTTRGCGVTKQTEDWPRLVTCLHKVARYRPKDMRLPYTSISLNPLSSLRIHKDSRNSHLPSSVIAFGDYEGGEFWVEDPAGTHHPPRSAIKEQDQSSGPSWKCRKMFDV